MHEAISAQAARTPQHEAICFQGQSLSYRELEEKAVQVAARLLERGVVPGDIVGICMERSPELVIAVLAIMKTGAAYLPLDPDYPPERIAFMIEDSQTRLIVANAALAADARLAARAGRSFSTSSPGSGAPPMFPVVDADSAAYVIYTSGSTGRPKGVVVTHRNVMNFFAGMDPRIPHEPAGRWLAVTSLSFDISVLELCWTLARGLHRRRCIRTPRAGATAQGRSTSASSTSPATTHPPRRTVPPAAGRAPSSPTSKASPRSGRPSGTSTPSAASTPTRR